MVIKITILNILTLMFVGGSLLYPSFFPRKVAPAIFSCNTSHSIAVSPGLVRSRSPLASAGLDNGKRVALYISGGAIGDGELLWVILCVRLPPLRAFIAPAFDDAGESRAFCISREQAIQAATLALRASRLWFHALRVLREGRQRLDE
jgi:hypothetical protein